MGRGSEPGKSFLIHAQSVPPLQRSGGFRCAHGMSCLSRLRCVFSVEGEALSHAGPSPNEAAACERGNVLDPFFLYSGRSRLDWFGR